MYNNNMGLNKGPDISGSSTSLKSVSTTEELLGKLTKLRESIEKIKFNNRAESADELQAEREKKLEFSRLDKEIAAVVRELRTHTEWVGSLVSKYSPLCDKILSLNSEIRYHDDKNDRNFNVSDDTIVKTKTIERDGYASEKANIELFVKKSGLNHIIIGTKNKVNQLTLNLF